MKISWYLDIDLTCYLRVTQHQNNHKKSPISFRGTPKLIYQPKHPIYYPKIAIFIYFPIHHPTGLKNGFFRKNHFGFTKNMKNYAIDILKNRNRNTNFLSSTASIDRQSFRKKNPISHQLWHRNKEGAREYIISSKSYCGFLFRLTLLQKKKYLLIFLYIRRSMTIN